MKICEIFHSVQGEGIHVGTPSVFIRFFGCNLACTFCDTKFSWHPDHADFSEFSVEEVGQKILSFPASHLVFTGGEPALFQDHIRAMVDFLQKNSDKTFTLELETNGSRLIEDDMWTTINISPKGKNSGNKPYGIAAHNFPEKTVWKFVVEGEKDIPEILEWQKKYSIPREKILLMPQAQTRQAIEHKSPLIIELCQKYNFRFCPRLHIWLYSDQKGV